MAVFSRAAALARSQR